MTIVGWLALPGVLGLVLEVARARWKEALAVRVLARASAWVFAA